MAKERKILRQKVFHDGVSMVVLKPGDEYPVPQALVSDWEIEGTIAKTAASAHVATAAKSKPAATRGRKAPARSKPRGATKPAAKAVNGSRDGNPPASGTTTAGDAPVD